MEDGPRLEMLPGARWARYALPVDYPPSRRFQERWTLANPIKPLHGWFSEHCGNYLSFLAEMRRLLPYAADIPVEYSESNPTMPSWDSPAYGPFDSLALHTMIGLKRPARYFEIGTGTTTCFAHHAIARHNLKTEILSIDPAPLIGGMDQICNRVVRDGLETCDLSVFDELEENDILFFDGTHRSFLNSDVTVFFIDILPRLKPGVVVHIHDIYLPWDYPEPFHNWYWNEQYMLAVYLMGNRRRIDPILPVAFVTRDPRFASALQEPFLAGDANVQFNQGGAMWFTHIA